MSSEIGASGDPLVDFDEENEPMVQVENLKKHFTTQSDLLGRTTEKVRAVDGVDISIDKGETFGLVGESGSGKTTIGRSILRIVEPTAGSINIAGQDVMSLSGKTLRRFRRNMQIVFQDPTSSLNPKKSINAIIKTPMKVHDIGTEAERNRRVEELLDMVDLPSNYRYKTPSELSGGQKQRVGIARAVATNPEFVVLDEPTSALDVSVQARVVNILEDLQEEYDITYLFITHNLSLLKNVADYIGVLYLGRLVEVGPTADIFQNSQHPYTQALMSAIPAVTEEDRRLLPPEIYLEGQIPDPREKPSGCSFRSRCPEEFDACSGKEPEMYEVGDGHWARCFLHDDAYEQTL
jgi:oligopeptide transport system ATP-binding protein